jgi:hypothetical protein
MTSATELRYSLRDAQPRWLKLAFPIGVTLVLVTGLGRALAGQPLAAQVPRLVVLGVLVGSWLLLRRADVVVDQKGIRVPLRGAIGWDDVVGVEQAGPWSDVVRVRCKDGTSRPVALPPGYTEQVAEIGGKPVLPRADRPG